MKYRIVDVIINYISCVRNLETLKIYQKFKKNKKNPITIFNN